MSMTPLKKCKNKPLYSVVHARIITKENVLSMQVSSVFTMVKRYAFGERRFTTTGAEFKYHVSSIRYAQVLFSRSIHFEAELGYVY